MNAGTLVPQLFYDLLSRIAPGALALPTIIAAVLAPRDVLRFFAAWASQPAAQRPSTTEELLWGLLFAYFSGTLLRGVDYLALEGISRLRSRSGSPTEPLVRYDLYYRIKIEQPEAGSRITKIKAEGSMAAVLETGFVISILIDVGFILHQASQERFVFGSILVLAILAMDAFRRHVRYRLRLAVSEHCKILKIPETEAAKTA
jgi:hypothetical protein